MEPQDSMGLFTLYLGTISTGLTALQVYLEVIKFFSPPGNCTATGTGISVKNSKLGD
jgi:hypothetical protein